MALYSASLQLRGLYGALIVEGTSGPQRVIFRRDGMILYLHNTDSGQVVEVLKRDKMQQLGKKMLEELGKASSSAQDLHTTDKEPKAPYVEFQRSSTTNRINEVEVENAVIDIQSEPDSARLINELKQSL